MPVTTAISRRVSYETPVFDSSAFSAEWDNHMPFALTEEQLSAVTTVMDEVIPQHGQAVLEGPAGTGKSTTITALMIAASQAGYTIRCTSPTHKATSVLQDNINVLREGGYDGLDACTIHSLLKLRPKRSFDGAAETFSQTGQPDLDDIDLLIVDECSMIGKDLYQYCVDACRKADCALLFTGDPYQLQPVGETKLSQTFSNGTQLRLTEVVRHTGPVLELATRVRGKRFLPQVRTVREAASSIITYESMRELQSRWIEQLQEAVASRDSERIDNIRMLCWKNANRRKFNLMARHAIWGKDVAAFLPEDVIVTLKPLEVGDRMLLMNNQQLVITAATQVEGVKPLFGKPYSYTAWKLECIGINQAFYVLDDSSMKQFKADVKALAKDIKSEQAYAERLVDFNSRVSGVRAAKKRWATEYFPLTQFFAEVDFGYAMTIHKSQGSTYNYVYICDDYTKSPYEKVSLLYVALTRARYEVHHIDTGFKKSA